MSWLVYVRFFHEYFGFPKPDTINIDDEKNNQLRLNLIKEELQELEEALEARNKVEVLDALCDLLYVVLGAVIALGYAKIFNQAFNRVHVSNLSKACDSEKEARETQEKYKGTVTKVVSRNDKYMVYRVSDNKLLKSVHYSPVVLKDLVEDI